MDFVKAEKERAMLRYRRLRQAAVLSRWLLEVVAAVVLLSWSSDRLPGALALCAGHLRRLPAVLCHPASAFLLGNLIVVTLFAKSGQSAEDVSTSPPQCPSAAGEALDHHCYYSYFSAAPPPHLHREEDEEEVVVYEDKAVCFDSTTASASSSHCSRAAASTSLKKGAQKGLLLPRSRSGRLREGAKGKLLRRWETDLGARPNVVEKRWPPEEEEDEGTEEVYEVADGGRKAWDDDNEEFRMRIEAFIAKQLRSIEREEESLLLAAKAATAGAVMVAAGVPDPRCR